jgi:hypothetical protein
MKVKVEITILSLLFKKFVWCSNKWWRDIEDKKTEEESQENWRMYSWNVQTQNQEMNDKKYKILWQSQEIE